MKISKFELAAVKRTASTVKNLRRKAENIKKIIDVNTATYESYVEQINSWEKPLIDKFGFDSKFILEHYDPETKELVLQETPIVEEVSVEEVNNMLNDGMLREAEPSSEEETPVDEVINEDAVVSNYTSESSEVEEGCFVSNKTIDK